MRIILKQRELIILRKWALACDNETTYLDQKRTPEYWYMDQNKSQKIHF